MNLLLWSNHEPAVVPPGTGGVAAHQENAAKRPWKAQTGWSFWRPACSAHAVSKNKCGIYNVVSKEERRKELRNSSTVAETVLWKYLKVASSMETNSADKVA